MNKKPNTVSCGVVNLSQKDGGLYKRTLICHTGSFKGVYGPVEITEQRLLRIAEKYNRARSKPQNQFDFAPILIDHERKADNTKGRVLAELSVDDWVNPDTDVLEKGLYGPLRVDNVEAQTKIDNGTYSQVSLSFDEEDDELYEVSFVAVEAARRSQVLAQGENIMSVELQNQLKQANDNHQALQGRVRTSLEVRKAVALALGENLTATQNDLIALSAQLETGLKDAKTALLKSQFKGLIREGRLSKAEFDKLDMVKLSAMPAESLKLLVGSYKDRPVSPHVQQFGQTGAQPTAPGKMSPAMMREAINLQKSGKGSIALAAGDEEPAKKDPKASGKKPGDADQAGGDTDMDDFEGALQKMGEVEPIVNRAKDFMKKMSESLKKMSEQNDKDAA